jgi:hypothetical protein
MIDKLTAKNQLTICVNGYLITISNANHPLYHVKFTKKDDQIVTFARYDADKNWCIDPTPFECNDVIKLMIS